MDINAANRTAAAAKSLDFLISGCFSGRTKSARCSMLELIASREKTDPIQNNTAIHS